VVAAPLWDGAAPEGVNWRFRVPDGEEIGFNDGHLGPQRMIAGRDFGDFIVAMMCRLINWLWWWTTRP
jgi:hypothetical protein